MTRASAAVTPLRMHRRALLTALLAAPLPALLPAPLTALLPGCRGDAPAPREVLLAAATSLRAAVPALAEVYRAAHPGVTITATYGASGDLRRQVEGGAPIDGVLFASAAPVDALIAGGHADPSSRRRIALNRLVLIGPRGAAPLTFATLDRVPAGERIAIGDPGPVPAGQYARDALQRLGQWDALQGRLVLGGDVAAVLAYVRRGEVAAGIVYKTEIRGIDDVVVLDEARGDWAPRPEVVGAVLQRSRGAAEAARFLAFTASPEGRRVLVDLGFDAP